MNALNPWASPAEAPKLVAEKTRKEPKEFRAPALCFFRAQTRSDALLLFRGIRSSRERSAADPGPQRGAEGAKPAAASFRHFLSLFSATSSAPAPEPPSFSHGLAIYGHTLLRVRLSLLTIAVMMALGFTTRYSGTDTTMGLAMAGTGWLFPFFSPLIGWLGVALTGSDTSSNVLFGNLQRVSAEQLGFPPLLMCAANSSGGVMGKMIDAQSIVVASVATGGQPESPAAGTILRAVFWHSLALATLMGVFIMAQAYLWPGVVPK